MEAPTRICPNGHKVYSPLSLYCPECGAYVGEYKYPKCPNGHFVRIGDKFCDRCGARVRLEKRG